MYCLFHRASSHRERNPRRPSTEEVLRSKWYVSAFWHEPACGARSLAFIVPARRWVRRRQREWFHWSSQRLRLWHESYRNKSPDASLSLQVILVTASWVAVLFLLQDLRIIHDCWVAELAENFWSFYSLDSNGSLVCLFLRRLTRCHRANLALVFLFKSTTIM